MLDLFKTDLQSARPSFYILIPEVFAIVKVDPIMSLLVSSCFYSTMLLSWKWNQRLHCCRIIFWYLYVARTHMIWGSWLWNIKVNRRVNWMLYWAATGSCKDCSLFQLVGNCLWLGRNISCRPLSTWDSKLRYQTSSGYRVMQNIKHFVGLPIVDIFQTCRRLKSPLFWYKHLSNAPRKKERAFCLQPTFVV